MSAPTFTRGYLTPADVAIIQAHTPGQQNVPPPLAGATPYANNAPPVSNAQVSPPSNAPAGSPGPDVATLPGMVTNYAAQYGLLAGGILAALIIGTIVIKKIVKRKK